MFHKGSFEFLRDDAIVATTVAMAEKSRGGILRPETVVQSIQASLRLLFGTTTSK